MSEDELNRELAKAAGWEKLPTFPNAYRPPRPNYSTDLNACHELEKKLTDEQWTTYRNHIQGCPFDSEDPKDLLHVSARVRAECLLKTLKP